MFVIKDIGQVTIIDKQTDEVLFSQGAKVSKIENNTNSLKIEINLDYLYKKLSYTNKTIKRNKILKQIKNLNKIKKEEK